ncbi:MAG: hypothetical protein ACRDHG_02605 [Anaerolineales bacterium]
MTPVSATAGLATYQASERGQVPIAPAQPSLLGTGLASVPPAVGMSQINLFPNYVPPIAVDLEAAYAAAGRPVAQPGTIGAPGVAPLGPQLPVQAGADVISAVRHYFTGIGGGPQGRGTAAARATTVPGPRVPLGSQRTFGDIVSQVVAHDAYGNPVYRQLGSAGPPDFRTQMTDLAIKAFQGDAASETRLKERLQFVNLGYGGSQARHDAAVVNLSLQLARGNYPDIVSDMNVRELPWQQLGFASYQEYLRYLGYQDLGNGTWRRLAPTTGADLGIPAGPGGGDAERGTSGSLAPGASTRGFGTLFDLTNWRI